MARIGEVCRHVRSKNAGPFWVTVDFFFPDDRVYRQYRASPDLVPELFGHLYGTDPKLVKILPVDSLHMVKISFPRANPQGWKHERDMHAGQLFARLLDVDIRQCS